MRSTLLALVLVSLPSVGSAQGAVAVQPSAGLSLTGTGVGVGGTAKLTPMFSASAEFSVVPFALSVDLGEIEDVSYETDISVWSLTLMGHVHPLGGGFALGAGVYFGGYGLSGTGVPNGTVEIGDETYTASELGTVTADFRLGGPAVVFELGRRGRGLNAGLGVAIPARPSVEVTFSGSAASDPAFQENVDREVRDIEDELGVVPVLPFLRLGYQFGL